MAAVLSCGSGVTNPSRAVLSHRSAAALWGLLPPPNGPVDVSVFGEGGRRQRRGVRVHRCPSLVPAHATRRSGIPVTTPVRTISDLRRVVSEKELRRAVRQAGMHGLFIGFDAAPDRTRSELEHLFLRLCRRHRLPPPEVNARIGSMIVDFLWSAHRLIVETDGYRYHRGRAAFEDDRARDLELRSLGYEVIRLSYRQVVEEPEQVAAVLGVALRT